MAPQSHGSSGLDWEFGSFLLRGAFARLGQGLRWMFWGSVLQAVGGGGLLVGFGLALQGLIGLALKACLFASGGMVLIGSIILLLGEQRCLHLELPLGMTHTLPGRRWLLGAYGCHLAVILARFVKQWIGRGLVSWLTLPLSTLGFVLLLLFLRQITSAISRADLRRLIDLVFVLALATITTAALIPLDTALHLGLFKAIGRIPALVLLVMPVLMFAAMGLAYLVLLWRMGTATSEFAAFLAPAAEPVTDLKDGSELTGVRDAAL